jgi:hypothetical protein
MCRFFKANFECFRLTCLFTRYIAKVTVTHNSSRKLNRLMSEVGVPSRDNINAQEFVSGLGLGLGL